MEFKNYNKEKHEKAVRQIWLECGWIEDKNYKPLDKILENTKAMVAELNGNAECLVIPVSGNIRYQDKELALNCIAGVTTGLVARRQRLAGKLTSKVIAREAENGAKVSTLGIFEQGYYNKLGFGNGKMKLSTSISPINLDIDIVPRVPVRLTPDDAVIMHESRLRRLRHHGGVNLDKVMTETEVFYDKGFGFGYLDDDGKLGHHMFLHGLGKENGPWSIEWMAYRNMEELLELLALIKSFEAQIHLVKLSDPPHVQLQDFMKRPFRYQALSRKGEYQNNTRAYSCTQFRINDVPACFAVMSIPCEPIKFNIKVTDPIAKYLDKSQKWQGVSGSYIAQIGKESWAKLGEDPNLPTLTCSVNDLTRFWLGIKKASVLTICGDFKAPKNLIEQFDKHINLPPIETDWTF